MSVVIRKYNEIVPDNLAYTQPTLNGMSYNGGIYYNGKQLYLQTPKCNVVNYESQKYIELDTNANKKFTELIQKIDNETINRAFQNSNQWFSKSIPKEIIEKNFIFTNQSKSDIIRIPINEDIKVFNCDKQIYTQEIVKDDVVLCILKCNGFQIWKHNIAVSWELVQLKIYTEPSITFDNYLFDDSTDETETESEPEELELINNFIETNMKEIFG